MMCCSPFSELRTGSTPGSFFWRPRSDIYEGCQAEDDGRRCCEQELTELKKILVIVLQSYVLSMHRH